MSEKSVPKRQYTNRFKVEAIRLSETVEQLETARMLGAPVAALGNCSLCGRSSEDDNQTSLREMVAARKTRPFSSWRRGFQRQCLRPLHERPYRVTTESSLGQPIAPNLLNRRFDDWLLNHARVSNITFFRPREGWLYLADLLDLASQRVVGRRCVMTQPNLLRSGG